MTPMALCIPPDLRIVGTITLVVSIAFIIVFATHEGIVPSDDRQPPDPQSLEVSNLTGSNRSTIWAVQSYYVTDSSQEPWLVSSIVLPPLDWTGASSRVREFDRLCFDDIYGNFVYSERGCKLPCRSCRLFGIAEAQDPPPANHDAVEVRAYAQIVAKATCPNLTVVHHQ